MTTATGTGTRAVGGGAVTAAALLADIRVALADEDVAVWSDAALLSFLNEAVREYTQHRPVVGDATIALSPGERRYALLVDVTAVLSVKYPGDREPPSYIYAAPYKSPYFAVGRHYDFLLSHDLRTPPQLLLSFDPEPGTTLVALYQRPHDHALAAASYLTVPAAHHHVLVQYVLFAAARRLQQREQAAPTSGSALLMSQLAANTRRLELAYLNALNRVLTEDLGGAVIVGWKD